MTVTAVLQDLPSNTHLNTEIFGSRQSGGRAGWAFSGARVYAYVTTEARRHCWSEARRGIADVDRPTPPKPLVGKASDIRVLAAGADRQTFISRRLERSPMTPGGDPRTIRAIAVVGVLVLLLASINFVNLKTARAARRAVEVGVRKVCGAERWDLIVQFIGESLVYTTLAMLIATALRRARRCCPG